MKLFFLFGFVYDIIIHIFQRIFFLDLPMKDYYEILGVSRQAGQEDIKKAFKTLGLKWHPDRNKGNKEAEEKFKEINGAYEVLKDEKKRAAYDRMGHDHFTQSASGGGGGHGGAHGFRPEDISDIFESMFEEFMGGGQRRRQRKSQHQKGRDLYFQLEITLEEAFSGVQTRISYPTFVTCNSCQGSGAQNGSKPITCAQCDGQGSVYSQRGFLTIEQECPKCKGEGQMVDKPCGPCKGQGRTKSQRETMVQVPAGIDENSAPLRLTGQGEAGAKGGSPGDLYVQVQVKPHDIFQRQGSDLILIYPISFSIATLGKTLDIPTIEGKSISITIPPGSQHGDVLTIKSQGMPHLSRKVRGNLNVTLEVYTPVNLTTRQKELLEEFQKEEKETNSTSKATGILERLKGFFRFS